MFNDPSVIVGLEIGTSKVCAVVGELTADNALNIIGVGQAKSNGVRKGEIVNRAAAEEDIRNAIVEAEEMSKVEIRSVYLGVSGAHIRGFTNRGVHPVVSADREISEEDVQDVVKNAKAVNLPQENHLMHAMRQLFIVDDQNNIPDPIGMLGARLEVDVHVIHGSFNRLQNAVLAVKSLQLEVEEVVFNGLAASLAMLTKEQKELGTLVIDLGGGTTDYTVYAGGIIRHTGVLAVGGDHVTNDLAIGLKIALGRAEGLKLEHGTALPDEAPRGQTVSIPGEVGLPAKSVNLDHLRRIMHLRLEEIFQLIGQDLERADMLHHLRGGIVLCGGGARIPGIAKLGAHIFGVPVSTGKTSSVNSIKSTLDQPEFAAAIGLVKFGSTQQRRRANAGFFGGRLGNTFGKLLRLGA